MATIVKIQPLFTLLFLPKKLDNHVSLELTNDCAKFEGASVLKEGKNRVLQTGI